MGQGLAATGIELANPAVETAFVAVGPSVPVLLYGSFNICLWGNFQGSVQLERTFDGGVTWLPVSANSAGAALVWTGAVSLSWTEPEAGVGYRLNCTQYTSGPINYRLSGSSDVVLTGGVGR